MSTRELFHTTGLRRFSPWAYCRHRRHCSVGGCRPQAGQDCQEGEGNEEGRRLRSRRVRSTSSYRLASSASRSTPTARRSPVPGSRPGGAATRHRPASSASSRRTGIIAPISTAARRCPTCSESHGPASHCMPGCFPAIPLRTVASACPTTLPSYLWSATKMNARVIVTHGDVAPVDVAHPRLFAYKKPEPPAVPEQSSEGRSRSVRTAEAADPGKASDALKVAEARRRRACAEIRSNEAVEPSKVPAVSAEAPSATRPPNRPSSRTMVRCSTRPTPRRTRPRKASKPAPVAAGAITAPPHRG